MTPAERRAAAEHKLLNERPVPTGQLTKVCTKCGKEKPRTPAHFNRHGQTADGLDTRCKDCEYARGASDEGREYFRLYHQKNKEARNLKSRRLYYEDHERHLEYARARRARLNEHYVTRQQLLDDLADYARLNRDRFNTLYARRRAQKLNATPEWLTVDQHDEIAAFYTERERITKETGVEHHVDHIVPLQGKNFCGLHVPWNLQVIPASENLSKNNSLPNEVDGWDVFNP